MGVVNATLITATAIDLVHNLWELTIMIDDDPGKVRKYKVCSRYPFRNSEIRRFKVTFEGKKVVQIEPIERQP